MENLQSYLCGEWGGGEPVGDRLLNPATEEELAVICSEDRQEAALDYAREGSEVLRGMTFSERGKILLGMAKALKEGRTGLADLSVRNGGSTLADAKWEMAGAIWTLTEYGNLGVSLGDRLFLLDGDGIRLHSEGSYEGQHIWIPRQGAALQINPDNFPVWEIAEKMACSILAGMAVIAKPASVTALVAHRMAEVLVDSGVLPRGTFQLLLRTGTILDHVGDQDVVAFTGSSETGDLISGETSSTGARLNREQDSLNAAVLGPDVKPGEKAYGLFLADVISSMTRKQGQVCRAYRRVFVPEPLVEQVWTDLTSRLAGIQLGDPSRPEVSMGPLVSRERLESVTEGISLLERESEVVFRHDGLRIGVLRGKGFFQGPVLLLNRDPENADRTHTNEVFGPVATVMGYDGDPKTAARLVNLGGGTLVTGVYSDDSWFIRNMVLGCGSRTGTIYLGTPKSENPFGPGTAHPRLVHGGPGRAGGGCELGGLRGLELYMQRVALAGDSDTVENIVR